MSLLNEIKKNPNLRSLFGKQELQIIENQLQGIRLKPSEKTRLSRDIRKKFKAIQALAQYVQEFNLKQGSDIKEIIEDSKKEILNSSWHSKIKKIYLFGSTAEHTRTFRSDIDIAVELTETDLKDATLFRMKVGAYLDRSVDLQVYNILPEKLKKEIDSKGKIIWKKE